MQKIYLLSKIHKSIKFLSYIKKIMEKLTLIKNFRVNYYYSNFIFISNNILFRIKYVFRFYSLKYILKLWFRGILNI